MQLSCLRRIQSLASVAAMAVVVNFIVVIGILHVTSGWPSNTTTTPHHNEDDSVIGPHSARKAAYKAGPKYDNMQDMLPSITLDSIKAKLQETGIFNWQDPSLTEREKKELAKVFEAAEIMMTSRARQPANVQSMFTTLRLIERVVKKQLKEGQISDSLVAKFQWENLPTRTRRAQPYHYDKDHNMRIFNLDH